MSKINHRDLEQCIGGQSYHCDDYLQLKVAGYFSTYNNVVVSARKGEDHFRLSARGPRTDISEAILLDSRYLVIGDIKSVDSKIFTTCALQNITDAWMELPDNLFVSRLLIAGAARIITIVNDLPMRIAQTPEYKQALLDRKVIELIC